MTIVVALKHEGDIYMGCDSAGTRGISEIRVRKDPKVAVRKGYITGFTDSFRMGQLLQYELDYPDPPKTAHFKFMVKKVIPAVRECFGNHGFTSVRNQNKESGGEFLIGFSGSLYHIFSDFQVAEMTLDYTACGCGDHYALGSLASTEDMKPRERVLKALKVAGEFSNGIRPPYRIKVLKHASK